jgi:hypothetical protein
MMTLVELRKTWQLATTFIDSKMTGAEDGKSISAIHPT